MRACIHGETLRSLSAETVYLEIGRGDGVRSGAASLVELRHWYHEVARFDSRTGEALPRPINEVVETLCGLQTSLQQVAYKDRLFRIFEHCRESIQDLMRQMVERLVEIEGMTPESFSQRKPFSELTALDPAPRLTLEYPGCPPACRLIDLFCPI